MWRAGILTLFPAMFPGPLGLSLAGDALARGTWSCEPFDIRDQGIGRHRAVDDRPAGGGPGMVMRADVVAAALDACVPGADERPKLLMSPRGRPLTQAIVRDLAAGPGVVVVCGRFEGIDERVIAARGLREISVGDYVLSGGEIAALALLDACVRILPGVMGAAGSGTEESFEHDLLEYPQYTRPRNFEGHEIPDVLLGGDHGKIASWRLNEARRLTADRRPDLLARKGLGGEGMTDDPVPPFARDYTIDDVTGSSIQLHHRNSGHWWRFDVAETNGRRVLVHAGQGDGPADRTQTIDAFDAATREARRRGLVD